MNQVDALRELVATLLWTTPDQIGPETSLLSLDNSLGGAKLGLGLKRIGLVLPLNVHPATFGELEAALSGNAKEQEAARQAIAVPAFIPKTIPSLTHGLQVGLDIQDIHSLPSASDYWEHEFYRGIFGKTEIAYALLQSEPRIHLAGFWCAKEALRKCDSSLSKVDMASITVAHDEGGRPFLLWQRADCTSTLPHALSISHTGDLASAVVILAAGPAPSVTPPAPQPGESNPHSVGTEAPASAHGSASSVRGAGLFSYATVATAIAVIVGAVWMFWRT